MAVARQTSPTEELGFTLGLAQNEPRVLGLHFLGTCWAAAIALVLRSNGQPSWSQALAAGVAYGVVTASLHLCVSARVALDSGFLTLYSGGRLIRSERVALSDIHEVETARSDSVLVVKLRNGKSYRLGPFTRVMFWKTRPALRELASVVRQRLGALPSGLVRTEVTCE
jgi:hypothetical protein